MINNNQLNLRVLGAFYFAGFATLFNLLAKYLLFIFAAGVLLPFFSSTLLALLLGAIFGGLLGIRIATANKPSRVFAWGVVLAIIIIPFYSLGLQLIYYCHNHSMYNNLHQWQDYVVLYGVIMLFFILVAGIWLIPLTGCAALLFNRRFIPAYRIYLSKQQQSIQASKGRSPNADDRK